MCGCGGASGAWTSSQAQSGYWSGSTTQVDGPWIVQLPIFEVIEGAFKVVGFETSEVPTYSEADSLVRQRDPRTGRIRGGGIRRKAAA